MKRFLASALLLTLFCGAVQAQESRRITGIVVEEDTSQPVIQAGVELLAEKDSSRLDVVVTDMNGKFSVRAAPGTYILKISYTGCTTQYRTIQQTVSPSGLNVGTIPLAREAVNMDASVITAKADPITVKADTVIYNAAAFNVSEDADLDELLKKIPGLEVDGNGNVSLHGRAITQLMVNGKRYFGGNVKTGLKNIPAAMVDNIKAYERPSEQARLVGVEDGESEPVLDVSIKKSMMDGWQSNINFGGGDHWRHYTRINANKITKSQQQTFILNNHNTVGKASINATNRNQVGTGSSGDATFSNIGYTFSKDTKQWELAGHFQYSGTEREQDYRNRSQSVQASGTTFNNVNGLRFASAPVLKGDFTAEWRKNKDFTMVNKVFFQYDEANSWTLSRGRSFNSDPYKLDSDPNDYIGFDWPEDPFKKIRVNGTRNTVNAATQRYNGYVSVLARLRDPKQRRRSFVLRSYFQMVGNNNAQSANYLTRYYRIKKNPDSLLVRSNYLSSFTDAIRLDNEAALYNPLGKKWGFHISLRADYTHHSQGKSYYNLAAVDEGWRVGQELGRRHVKSSLPDGYKDGFTDYFSGSVSFDRLVLPLVADIYRNTKKFNITIGGVLREQLSWLHYEGNVISHDHFDVGPSLVFKYRFNKSKQLSFVYRSWVAGSPVGSMMPITNGTNPLYISTGNPDLLSPVVHNANLNYNTSNKKRQNSFTANISYNNTFNAISTSTVYDPETGVRTSKPYNIDGNWKAVGSMAITKTLRNKLFSFTNHTSGEYQNNVSYLYNNKLKKDEKNVMSRLMVKERFESCFRNKWLEIVLNAGGEYTDESSRLRPEMSQNPFTLIGGASTQISFPWKMRFETDFTAMLQRGWSYDELNKNYYVWNAELSQRIMKGKATLRLGWYDILHSQDNLTRTLSSASRSISIYNGVSSYIMLRFFYRFKL